MSNYFVQYFGHSSPPSSGTGGAFSCKNSFSLKATVIIDYQNVQITGSKLYGSNLGLHKHYIDPIKFAETLIEERNSRIAKGYAHAMVSKVLVYRGLPSNVHNPIQYARNLTQAAYWQRDNRVMVTHRALKYMFSRDSSGKPFLDNKGAKIPVEKKEKGIDVLCALALVREVRTAGLVILASQDTDLIPAINEATSLRLGKVETCSWYVYGDHSSREIRSESSPVWNTRLNANNFANALDTNDYSKY